jgi:allantoate deiminase
LLDAQDASGSSIAEVMAKEAGFEASEANLRQIAHQGHISAYIEVHIEQGPILQLEDKPVGVVSSIVGQKRLQVQLKGGQGHAGAAALPVFLCFCSLSS